MAPHGIVGISRFLCTPPRRFACCCGRSFCANAVSCRLAICILLPARPSLPLRKDPRPQRQAQHLGVVPVFLFFCANAVSCRLAICKLLPARPSLPLRKDPRPQRQAQHLGVVPVFLLFSADAASCRLVICKLLPARPSLPLRKDPCPQRQAQNLDVVRVGEYYVKTAVFLCKYLATSLGKL